MRRIAFDAESDGLLDVATTLHCLVLRDLDSDRVVSCTNSAPGYHTIEEGLALLSAADVAYGHNAIKFDLPLIQKFYPTFTLKGVLRDTMITAQMRWAHIDESDFARFRNGTLPGELIGSHKLEAWGYRLGVKKVGVEIEDWSKWVQLMQDRCESDTAITKKLVFHIREAGIPKEALETEHELAYYLYHQERNGFPFDVEAAQQLQGKLAAKRQDLQVKLMDLFPPWQVSTGMFTPKVNSAKHGYVKGVPVERFKTVSGVFGKKGSISRPRVAERLTTLYGWTPTEFTEKGQAQVDEDVLEGLTYPCIPALKEYLLVDKRLGQIAEGKEAWLIHATQDSPGGGKLTGLFHIHGRVKQNQAITHRASHAKPNVSQVPKNDSPYGKECRALWHVPDGWVQVGADVSGLELRCLAHYMAKWDDGAYGKLVLGAKPNDPHTKTANILGISRDDGKTWFYAFLYGAGNEKLGKIRAPGKTQQQHEAMGAKDRKTFLRGLPALDMTIKAVQAAGKQRGFIKLIDGRRCYIRSEHAALNSLLQGTGAVICKTWIVEFSRRMTAEFGPQGWDGKWAAMCWSHDEVQLAVRPEIAERAGIILVESIRHMTQHFAFRVPLDGEYNIGKNWAECH